jgi:hypothetical protein
MKNYLFKFIFTTFISPTTNPITVPICGSDKEKSRKSDNSLFRNIPAFYTLHVQESLRILVFLPIPKGPAKASQGVSSSCPPRLHFMRDTVPV